MKKSKKSTSIIVALALTFCTATSLIDVQKVNAQGTTTDSQKKVIVVLKDKASTKDKTSKFEAQGKAVKELDNVHSITTSLTDSEIDDLKKDPNVRSVEEDSKVFAIEDAETVDWGVNTVGAENSWSSYTGSGVNIAVIDTGVATSHPDLADAISGGFSEVSYTTSYEDDNGHGTHVSGIIAARQNGTGIVGIAPKASIYAVKALDNTGSGYMSSIISGIDWAIDNDMDIISMSLGSSTGSTALQNACDTANADGILVVAAAGNNGSKGATVKSKDTITYPARYDSVIAVGATDQNDARASFSSTGKELDVVAPGFNILSDKYTGGTVSMSGTSMATPFVAGDLALLKEAHPDYSSTQLRNLLESTCKNLGATSLYGHGLIQAPIDPSKVNQTTAE